MAIQQITVTSEPFQIPVNVSATLAGQPAQPAVQPAANNHRLYAVAATVVLLTTIAALFFHTPATPPAPTAPPPAAAAPAPAAPAPVAVAPIVVQPVVVTPAPVVAAAPAPAPKAQRQVVAAPRIPAANNINMVPGRPTMLADGSCKLSDGRIGFRSGDLCLVKTN